MILTEPRHSSAFGLSPGAFPSAPQRGVSKAQLVPPQIQHLLIEAKNAIARDSGRRRDEGCQALVNGAALRFVNASEQVPDSKRVTLARLREDFAELAAPFFRCTRAKIEFGQGCAK